MKGLLYKDLTLAAQQLRLMVLYILLFGVVFIGLMDNTSFALSFVSLMMFMLSMNCFTYDEQVSYDKLVVNMTKYELKVDGKVVDTPPKELELLYHLASNPNRVYTRDQLLDEVWGFEYYGDSRTVDVHIKRLREKLEGVSDKWTLKTVWGVGYKFEVKE